MVTREPVIPLPWASRISSMPYLPGGGQNQTQTLLIVLSALDAHDGLATATVELSDGTARTFREAVKQIAPAGLVSVVDREHFAVSDEVREWMTTQDPLTLLAVFHRHVRFVGEMLHALDEEPKRMRQLSELAAADYHLQWSTLDQVRRRVTWMQALGLMEYKTNELLQLTDLGREGLHTLQLGGPDTAPESTAISMEIPTAPDAISVPVQGLTPTALVSRSPVLGYIPRGNGETSLIEALYLLVNAASPSISRAELLTFAQDTFKMSESSFGAALTTLTKSGLVEQTGFNIYSPTAPGAAWLETQSPLDLVLILHCKFLAVLELIPLLAEFDKAPDLARAAHFHLGLTRVDVGGIRTRLQLLKAAGLIVERANWRYQATPLGERIIHEIPLQNPLDEDTAEVSGAAHGGDVSSSSPATLLAQELVEAGVAGDAPVRLEKAVADAFTFLGFEARHIGGGGRTDVLATVEDQSGAPIRVIIDAKAARSGTVNEGAVSFDTLAEHKEKHRAQLVTLVGPGFEGGRVQARAEQNGVALISTDELGQVLCRHETSPLSAAEFIALVNAEAGARKDLESRWAQAERRTALLSQVVAVLTQEAREPDEVTKGALSADQLYLIVRDEMDPRPSTKDIEEVLQLLEHPLIGSIRRAPAGAGRANAYRLIDAPGLLSAKIDSVSQSIARVDQDS